MLGGGPVGGGPDTTGRGGIPVIGGRAGGNPGGLLFCMERLWLLGLGFRGLFLLVLPGIIQT